MSSTLVVSVRLLVALNLLWALITGALITVCFVLPELEKAKQLNGFNISIMLCNEAEAFKAKYGRWPSSIQELDRFLSGHDPKLYRRYMAYREEAELNPGIVIYLRGNDGQTYYQTRTDSK